MFCTKCGIESQTDAKFCWKCGSKLPQKEVLPMELPHSGEASQKTNLVHESPPVLTRQPNFIVRHWRGDYSLVISFWVIFFLLTLPTVILVGLVLTESRNVIYELGGMRASGAVTLAFYGFQVPLYVWTWVGIWRSAGKHVQKGGKAFWAGLAQIIAILAVLVSVGNFIRGNQVLSEAAKMVVGINDTPPYKIRLLGDGTELELTGRMPMRKLILIQ